jgi:hypothetical protein
MTRYRDLFEAELDARDIRWCRGDRWRSPAVKDDEWGLVEAEWTEAACRSRRSRGGKHSASGGAWAEVALSGPSYSQIHMGREVATRYGLQIALHEVAHIVLGHHQKDRRRVCEKEAEAEEWSFRRMQELGVPAPDKARKRAAEYVDYRKQRGDRVIARQAAKKKTKEKAIVPRIGRPSRGM